MALPAGRRGVRPDQVKPDGSLNVEVTPYSLPTASAETKGGVKIGSGLTMTDETLSADGYTLPTASADTKGGVKIGSGLQVTDDVLSVTASGGLSVKYSATGPEYATSVPAHSVAKITININQPNGDKNKEYINVLQYLKTTSTSGAIDCLIGFNARPIYFPAGGDAVTYYIGVYNPSDSAVSLPANVIKLSLLG